MTLLLRTSTDLNNSLTRLKITFHETAQEYFLSSKFDNVLSTFYGRSPTSNIISISEPNRFLTPLLRPPIELNKTFTRLKITFHETAQEYFLSSNFDMVLINFFVNHLHQILSLFQNLLALLHFYLGPQLI